jgi:hypothetical protein
VSGGGGAYKAAYDNAGNLVVIKTATNTQLYSSNTANANPGRAELQVSSSVRGYGIRKFLR